MTVNRDELRFAIKSRIMTVSRDELKSTIKSRTLSVSRDAFKSAIRSRIMTVCRNGIMIFTTTIVVPGLSIAQQAGSSQPFQLLFSGYHKIHFETADRQRFGSEYPSTFLRWELHPTVGVYGVPLSMNLLYTTEDNDPGGNAGRFQFGLSLSTDQLESTIRGRIQREMNESARQLMAHDPSEGVDAELSEIEGRMDQLTDLQANLDITSGRLDQLQDLGLLSSAERLALRFPTFGIGASYPQYSRYTMQGITVNGVHIEFVPGRAYLGTNIGKVRSPGGTAGFSRFGAFENDRRVYAGRLGYGRPFGRHIHLQGVFVDESEQNEMRNGFNGNGFPGSGMKNFITGLKFRAAAFSEVLDVQGELAGSFITRDTGAPEIDDPNLGNIPLISSLIDPNISSSADAAGMIEAALRFTSTGTRIRTGLQYVGPGYINLAVPALRNDLRELMGGVEQSFYKRQMTISANIRTERNNLNELKNYTRRSTRYDFQLALNLRDLPWVRVQYIPVIQKNTASDPVAGAAGEYTYNTTVINVISGYSVPVGAIISTSSINVSTQKSTTNLQSADASSFTFGLNQNIGFGRFNVNGGYQRFSYTRLENTLVRHDFTLGGSVRVLNIWMHEAGLRNSSGKDQVRVTGLWYRTSVPIRYIGTLEMMIENTRFDNPALANGGFAQTRFSTILTRSW